MENHVENILIRYLKALATCPDVCTFIILKRMRVKTTGKGPYTF